MNDKQLEALKKIQTTLAAVVVGDADTTMTVDKFLVYANEQVTKAMAEAPEKRTPRLKALHTALAKAVSDFGAMIATNTDSESVKVTVYTEDTTAADELSSKEISVQSAASGTGQGAPFGSFAMSKSVKDAAESIAALQKVLSGVPAAAEGEKPAKVEKTEKVAPAKAEPTTLAKNDGVDDEGWPENLNDPRYKETRKSATAPLFGYDSDPDANAAT